MGVGAGLYMYVVVVKSSRSLSHLLMSSCYKYLVHASMVSAIVTYCMHEWIRTSNSDKDDPTCLLENNYYCSARSGLYFSIINNKWNFDRYLLTYIEGFPILDTERWARS